jgi:hypothetical protein
MGELKLPKVRSGVTRKSPRFMIIFSKPKTGKTTALAMLDNNLLVDLENGAGFVDGMTIQANTIQELLKIADLVEAEGRPYKFITLDTATALEDDLIMPLAIKLYRNTPMGKSYDGDDLRKLPSGAGYLYIREAFKYIIDRFAGLTETLILTAHCLEKQIDKEGKEMFELEMDLSGKLKRIMASKADAIGYLHRKGNQTYLNFNGGGDTIIEARSPHLTNKEFLLIEKDEKTGTFKHNWNQIFIE